MVKVSFLGLINMYMCLMLPEDASYGAAYTTELGLPVPVINVESESNKVYTCSDIYGQWSTSESEEGSVTSLPIMNMSGIGIDFVYANRDIPYIIAYGDGNIYKIDRTFYAIGENEILPDVEHNTEYYVVPASFINSVARGTRRLSGSNKRMDYNEISDALLGAGNYLKVFDKSISDIDWELSGSIPYMGFMMCPRLKSVSGNNVTSVESMAFIMDMNLTEVNLPNVLHIGDMAFGMCMGIRSIEFPKIISIGAQAFYSCMMLTNADISNVQYLGDSCFDNAMLASIDIPKVTIIPPSCFYGCSLADGVNAPMVTSVGNNAFRNCSFTDISLPLCTSVNNYAFADNTKLINVNLPLCETINDYAFNGCTALQKLDLPSTTTIGVGTSTPNVFNGCTKFDTLILRSGTMCVLSAAASTVFTDTPIASGTGYIYVPSALLSTYKANSNWSGYSSRFRAIEDYPDICAI